FPIAQAPVRATRSLDGERIHATTYRYPKGVLTDNRLVHKAVEHNNGVHRIVQKIKENHLDAHAPTNEFGLSDERRELPGDVVQRNWVLVEPGPDVGSNRRPLQTKSDPDLVVEFYVLVVRGQVMS